MPKPPSNLLLVEDDLPIARVYQEYLRHEPYQVTHCENGTSALRFLEHTPPDIVVLDLHLPDISGFEVMEQLREQHPHCPIVVITAYGSIDTAVKAMKGGAADFLLKPFNKDRLIFTLRHTFERQQLAHIVDCFKKDFNRKTFCGFIGQSLAMQEVYQKIERAAQSKASVFITGESGTGKELAAEAIHKSGERADKPFIALNCGAIPDNLIESEIFGHVKGAFTSALQNRIGAAKEADGGTLFLDELCEMDLALQVKLLRFIQTSTFRPVGSDKTEKVNVRFICATNRDPWQEVEKGHFRSDLYYRLNVLPLHLPPLNERETDVIDLAHHFMTKFAAEEDVTFSSISRDAQTVLEHYRWPGNVRELQNVIRNALVLNDGPTITAEMLNFHGELRPNITNVTDLVMPVSCVEASGHDDFPIAQDNHCEIKPLWKAEHDMIKAALERFDGHVQKAAQVLEVSPSTLYRRMKDLNETATA